MHRNPRTRLTGFFLFAACLSSVAASSRGFAQQRLTLDWVFGEQGRTVARVPAFAWLDDGTAVIYDTQFIAVYHAACFAAGSGVQYAIHHSPTLKGWPIP